jgi:hypothetical protein
VPCAFCEGLLQPRSSRRILRKSRRCGVTLQKKRGPFMRSAALALVTAELLLACSAFHNVHVTPVRQTWPLAGLRVAGACTHTPPRRQCTRGTVQASGSERLTAASEATTRALAPDKRGSVHFINLSNGVEALPMLEGVPTSFVRIQSSHCEANNFNGILGGLDSTFLMYLAMGHDCYIYDFGSRNKKRKAPRAVDVSS